MSNQVRIIRGIPPLLNRLMGEFSTALNLVEIESEFERAPKFLERCTALASYLTNSALLPLDERIRSFLGHANWKFRVNAEYLAEFYKCSAELGQSFNYHQKSAIQNLFDTGELDKLPNLLPSFGLNLRIVEKLVVCAKCATDDDTRTVLHAELELPSGLRRSASGRDIRLEILQTLFASFLWVSLQPREMHRFFDPEFNDDSYCSSFWEELQRRSPRLFRRDEAVHFLVITEAWAKQFNTLATLRNVILTRVRDSYDKLNNYGFLVVLLQNIPLDFRDVSWELAADIVLFGEKHLERTLDRAYFRPDRIREETVKHIPQLDISQPRFDLANEGFTYRDCFILGQSQAYGIEQLLVLQKNHRDETVVPCPTCRSSEVEGNSYPSLGVKSWECRNPLCPDRSKYNRGKRYSFRGLAMQQAIDDERNDIAPDFVRQWRRDVVEVSDYDEVLEMIVRHYSIWGDEIRCFGELTEQPNELLGRVLHWESLTGEAEENAMTWFDNAAFFRRYGVAPTKVSHDHWINLGTERFQVFCGDSRYVLEALKEDSVDGAVTSPPYYNAREYSQWPNIYCYLQDMFEVNTQVFRVLKPGSLYFYNIFDCFDNENIVAFSAMGQKRVILSAYTVDLFRRIGFECIGNVVWDKGEIEGKRGFNAGNFSPFYQSPFNCWEHVLVFRKPGSMSREFGGNRVLRAQPVIKMVRGKNMYGHTAPFPEEIPMLCVKTLALASVILDPFAGSLTTGRVGVSAGLHAICIEQSEEYCELGLRLYEHSAGTAWQQEFTL